ncbi:MAG TPA: hypothetical protein VHZ76_00950 [Gammaproteobacteria bacterium]|nr:hypothetical protein [Gammaproteobacteria bacterium]
MSLDSELAKDLAVCIQIIMESHTEIPKGVWLKMRLDFDYKSTDDGGEIGDMCLTWDESSSKND